MEAGRFYELEVLRKTNIGYMLKYNDEEVFLHNKEANKELIESELINAFIYYDSEKRLAATMDEAIITTEKPGWVMVEDVIHNLGVFVNIGINKGMLIGKEFLPYDESLWPCKSERLFCILKFKPSRLTAKIVNSNEVSNYKEDEELNVDDVVKANVMRINEEGIVLYTEKLNYILVHKTQMRKKYHLGEEAEVRILSIDKRGIHGTLINKKEDMIDDDSTYILNYLKEIKTMNEDNSPEEILALFNMSKKAFKRAIGHLYKERLIEIKDGKIIYLDK